ncbi:MAG: hypothetical protein GY704_06460, partial [Phycisphaeraceae bacterium]|nr:hypothetical protein [Phycisphaeraceae bacterium]
MPSLTTLVTVVDAEGAPVSGACVELYLWENDDSSPWLAVFDQIGDPPAPSSMVETDGTGDATVRVAWDRDRCALLLVRREGFGLHLDTVEP